MTCPLCGRSEYPHEHHLATILNSRHYCPDGSKHVWDTRRQLWFWKRNQCTRCGERQP